MSRPLIALLALIVVLLILADSSLFTVNQNEQVLITQFGQVVRVIQKPGLNFKTPLIQSVLYFDKRLLNIELPGDQITLGDQRRLVVDSFTVYRITNPLLYYQAVGPAEEGIRGRMNSVVSAALRDVLADNKLLDVLSAKRDQIMAAIRDRVNTQMKGFGVAIEDVRIRRADLPEENTKAILARMQSERQRVAAQARAEGAEASAKIRADAERERTVLLAEARATADKLRGEGEAEATRISAQAYSQDLNFYNAWRTLQAYRDSFESGNSRLVLTPDNDFLRYLATPPTPTGQ
jgi:modulator of FtsH protease HflC